ncbi:MAG: porin [Azoarcus sp.]|nr:porin [Azoarcus sp.]
MQKKLIALAIAGLVSAPAFAQSSVTIYGTLDYGYTVQNNHVGNYAGSFGVGNVDRTGRPGARQGLDSGVSKANRIGFKVTEDLGNGLKVIGVLENGLAGDKTETGILNGTARQSYAALAGGFGTVAFGRHYTPQHLFQSAVDPFSANGVGSSANVLVKDQRLSNLVAYISPSWGGFSFITAYTNSYEADESVDNKSLSLLNLRDTRVIAFAPSFTVNGLFVGLNYHQAKFNMQNTGVEHLRVTEGYVSYDFGPVKVGALYGQRKTALNDDPAATTTTGLNADTDLKLTQWLVGATWKISANDSLLVSYVGRKFDFGDLAGGDLADAKVGQWAIGYEHALSKRTALYAHYAAQHQNSNQRVAGYDGGGTLEAALGVAGWRASGVGLSNIGGTTGYRQGVGIGLRHDF